MHPASRAARELKSLLLLAACWCIPTATSAAESIAEPERLTAGSADQFLATLDPAGTRMFYVSNENATTELYGADLNVRAPQRLFDEAADVTWPRASPDGRRLLYLSFRSAATGELCVRDLPGSALEVGERKCLTLGGRTAMQALWEPTGKSALVASRAGLGGAVDLRRFIIDGPADQPGELLLSRELSSPALSGDGKWLLFVPVAHAAGAANPTRAATSAAASATAPATAVRAARTLALARLDALSSPAREISFPLPGLPGFPAFSADGKFVYFVQYLNDTNLDGVVDANDRGVLFRVPFDSAQENPIDVAHAEQLTSAEHDCQYPFPGKDRLVATCLNTGSLDVFSLPLEGVVPRSWTREKLEDELVTNHAPWQRLLVYTRLLEVDTDGKSRALHLQQLIEAYLSMHEYQSAGFYSGQLEKLAAGEMGESWREEEGVAQVLHELARHRRTLAAVADGQSTSGVTTASRARIEKLTPLCNGKIRAVVELADLVVSEISDSLGEKGRALALLSDVKLDKETRPIVLHLYAGRARALFESLVDREHLLSTDRLLAEHPNLTEAERLANAETYLHDLLRGRSAAEQAELLTQAGRELPADSNAAYAVAVEQALHGLTAKNQTDIEARVMPLFEKTSDYERRRTLVHETVARAKATDSEALWYDIAERWAQASDKLRPGRHRTEAIYSKVGLERAYVEWAQGRLEAARTHFNAVTQHTSSLEAYADDIDTSLQSGATEAALEAEFRARFADRPDAPELLFALAYLEGRRLPGEKDIAQVSKDAEEGKERLKAAIHALPNSVPIHHLWAYLRHQEYLRTGDKNTAMRANAHYLIVLDLAREDPRYRAAALQGLGLLHSRLGNHSMAAGFLEERQSLPYANTVAELAVCLWRARSLLHSDHEGEAAAVSDQCVALIDADGALARFLPYALDRSALCHQDAGDAAGARARYERLAPMVAAMPQSEPDGRRNQFVVALGLAEAKLALKLPSEALGDLNRAEQLFELPDGISLITSAYPHKNRTGAFTKPLMSEDYQVLLTGMRARALTSLGDLAAAEVQTRRRLELLRARMERDGEDPAGDDDRRLFGLAEAQLGAARYQAHDIPAAIAEIEAGLRAADELALRTGTPVHGVSLALLREYADLHFEGKVPLEQLKLDLPARLSRLFGELVDRPQPKWLQMRDRYRLYLNRLALEGVPVMLQ